MATAPTVCAQMYFDLIEHPDKDLRQCLTTTVRPPELMTVEELAEYLQFSPSHIYKLLRQGRIRFLKIGSQYRFETAEINRWIADQQPKV